MVAHRAGEGALLRRARHSTPTVAAASVSRSRGENPALLRLKLPIALEEARAIFVYADPGHATSTGLRSWGAAHQGLWKALRKRGRTVSVVAIAREDRALERAETVLQNWASSSGPEARVPDPSAAREYAKVKRAVLTGDTDVLDSYGGVQAALKRAIEVQQVAQDRSSGVAIDGCATWRSARLWGVHFGG